MAIPALSITTVLRSYERTNTPTTRKKMRSTKTVFIVTSLKESAAASVVCGLRPD